MRYINLRFTYLLTYKGVRQTLRVHSPGSSTFVQNDVMTAILKL